MMQNLSMHVLDIAANSVRAKATKVSVAVVDSELRNQIKITVSDNGCGMNEEMCRKVQDPFFTSRTTRKIGLGVPFFKELSEQCGGEFSLKSKEGAGTEISASMQRDHWDTPPMGDIGDAEMCIRDRLRMKPAVRLLPARERRYSAIISSMRAWSLIWRVKAMKRLQRLLMTWLMIWRRCFHRLRM